MEMVKVVIPQTKIYSDREEGDFYFVLSKDGLQDVYGSTYFDLDEIEDFIKWLQTEYDKKMNEE